MTLVRYLGIGREASLGDKANATKYIETVVKIPPDQGWIIPDPICDASRAKYNPGPYRARGATGPFDVTPDNIGEILNAVMGASGYSKDGSNPYTHVWVCSNTLDSYCLHIGSEIEERILGGMLCNKLTLKATHGENLHASAEWVGPSVAEATTSLASLTRANLSALQPFVYSEASGNLTIGDGDKSANVYDFELTVDNGIPFDRGNLYTRYMPVNRRGARTVTGTISAYFVDDDEYDRFIAATSFNLILKFYRSASASLQLRIPDCIYLRDASHAVQPMDEPLVIDIPFQGFYDATYTELECTLVNAENVSYT